MRKCGDYAASWQNLRLHVRVGYGKMEVREGRVVGTAGLESWRTFPDRRVLSCMPHNKSVLAVCPNRYLVFGVN